MNTFNVATSTLRYAESKLGFSILMPVRLPTMHMRLSKPIDQPDLADIKANSDAIEAAYELYKIFMVANARRLAD